MKEKSKKIVVAVVVIGILLAAGIWCIYRAKDYTGRVPQLTPKTLKEYYVPGETIKAEDLVDVECKGKYRLDLWLDPGETYAKIVDGKIVINSSGIVGDVEMHVTVSGFGSEQGNTVDLMLKIKGE